MHVIIFSMSKAQKIRFGVSVLLLFLLSLLIYFLLHITKSKDLKVSFLNIGQGDSIFIQTPSGIQMLVDAGPDKKVLSELSKVMPFYDRSIDIVLATHPDKDHIGGIPSVLQRYTVDMLIESGSVSENGTYDELQNVANALEQKNGLKRIRAYVGQSIDTNDNVSIDILYPDQDVKGLPTNDASIIVLIKYRTKTFLLTGDAAFETEYRLLHNPKLGKVTVLKVGHHGSQYSTGSIFMDRISPEYAVISVGKNTYGHPTKTVLDILDAFHAKTLRTDEKGLIQFVTDGDSISYKTEK